MLKIIILGKWKLIFTKAMQYQQLLGELGYRNLS